MQQHKEFNPYQIFMEIHNQFNERNHYQAGTQFGLASFNVLSALYDISMNNDHENGKLTLSYPVADSDAICMIVATDGRVAGMQLLAKGTIATAIDTDSLAGGSYLLLIQNSRDRRIIGFTK